MVSLNVKTVMHLSGETLADFLSGSLPEERRAQAERHLSSCDECLEALTAAYEAVTISGAGGNKVFNKLRKIIMNKTNIYLLLAIISFLLSFITPRFFVQLLVVTLLLGMKWVADSRSARMLIMIREAWKRDGARGVTDILQRSEKDPANRL